MLASPKPCNCGSGFVVGIEPFRITTGADVFRIHTVAAGKQFVHSCVLHDLILMFGHSNQCRQVGGG